ncbi:MAG: response regulator receiver protein [Hyphomicrobiales bacterium]|nr:response regulator receiver protein [Hyphomicrobiales bacterium]MBV8824501.1 response regulator receiver protein [Hyphomicrobiales bacterium]
MLDSRSPALSTPARIAVVTGDAEFERLARSTFGGNAQINLDLTATSLAANVKFDVGDAKVVLVDIDADHPDEVAALQSLAARLGGGPPIVVVTKAFNESVARRLVQIRISDFLVKPVEPIELVRACARAAQSHPGETVTEAQIYTFLPAAGGVGLTTLAIQTAMMLMRKGQRTNASTCLVDLDFQHGACTDYLDLEPRLDLDEIEPRPERLDRQLLEVMLSHHSSGLAVIAAPSRPAEMRTFDPDMVTRLLDLVSSHFENVVIDMPRTWFPWTDSVLFGSNRLFIVTEMTVPGLRHAKQLVAAVGERLKGGPQPQVIVNRFEQHLFGPGLRRGDIEAALGDAFAGVIPNNYRLVREAIDRGIPLDEVKAGNSVTQALKKLVAPPAAAKNGSAAKDAAAPRLRALFGAR